MAEWMESTPGPYADFPLFGLGADGGGGLSPWTACSWKPSSKTSGLSCNLERRGIHQLHRGPRLQGAWPSLCQPHTRCSYGAWLWTGSWPFFAHLRSGGVWEQLHLFLSEL